jgi:hypothetical protein
LSITRRDLPRPRPSDLAAIKAALERTGVEFIDDVGVKLGKGAK